MTKKIKDPECIYCSCHDNEFELLSLLKECLNGWEDCNEYLGTQERIDAIRKKISKVE